MAIQLAYIFASCLVSRTILPTCLDTVQIQIARSLVGGIHHRERHDICMWCLGGDHDPFKCSICSSMEKKNLLRREEARQQFLKTGVWPKYFHSKSTVASQISKFSKASKVSKQSKLTVSHSTTQTTSQSTATPTLGLGSTPSDTTSNLSESSGRKRKRVLVIPKKKVETVSRPESSEEVPLQLFDDIVQEVVPVVPNVQ